MFKTAQKTVRLLIVISTCIFSILSLSLGYFVFGFHKEVPLPTTLAFWMEHDFSTGEQKLEDALAGPLARFTDSTKLKLYVHAGPLSSDGTLPGDLNFSMPSLLINPSNTANTVEAYAWLGQIRSKIELENPDVRAQIVNSIDTLLSAGFQGIHLDIEPIPRDDTAFLQLLKELRAHHPDLYISIAMDEWQPHGLSQWVARLYDVPIESYWSTGQVQSMLPYLNELVVMTYDTGFNDARLYEWWVEQQTIALTQILKGSSVELLVGLPSYEKGLNFNPQVENVKTGLVGFIRGASNLRSELSHLAGIAVYPYWEMSKEEWSALDSYFHSQP